MKTLKLLNKKFFLLILIFGLNSQAEEKPIDIWNIENKEKEKILSNDISNNSILENTEKTSETSIYNMQSQRQSNLIKEDQALDSKKINITGLYDPEDYGLEINMWSNSDGDRLKSIFAKLDKIKLSEDAAEIMNISILTNAYYPDKNISENEFLKLRSDWLIKNSDLELIEEYLVKNQILNNHIELTRYLVDQYLSESNVDKACEIFSKNLHPVQDEYLSKFNIYCLVNDNKNEQALVLLDLKKELGFKDKYFEKKMDYLLGYSTKIDDIISEKSILDFHLAHKTNPNFSFEPKVTTDKMIWKYLSSSNLLNSFQEIDISEIDKIATIEKAVHDKNYPEKDLFELYKRFQFNINQLIDAKESYKSLSNIEGRALIYQKFLLESDVIEKLKLTKILKTQFKKDNLNNAFDNELKKFLADINPADIPDNLTSFYYTNISLEKDEKNKIKFNNDIMHQSKLLNYFNGDYAKSKIEKDLDNFLKKIKKEKKYYFSKKDKILLEAIKSDGIQVSKKYEDLYKINLSEIPTDMQIMINNNEKGAALLRIIEVIGQDDLDRIDEDTIYFIISTLNQLDMDFIRNKILLKVLPLKV